MPNGIGRVLAGAEQNRSRLAISSSKKISKVESNCDEFYWNKSFVQSKTHYEFFSSILHLFQLTFIWSLFLKTISTELTVTSIRTETVKHLVYSVRMQNLLVSSYCSCHCASKSKYRKRLKAFSRISKLSNEI